MARQSKAALSSLATRILEGARATEEEILALAQSVLSRGKRKSKKKSAAKARKAKKAATKKTAKKAARKKTTKAARKRKAGAKKAAKKRR
jgi:hypothetical protein